MPLSLESSTLQLSHCAPIVAKCHGCHRLVKVTSSCNLALPLYSNSAVIAWWLQSMGVQNSVPSC